VAAASADGVVGVGLRGERLFSKTPEIDEILKSQQIREHNKKDNCISQSFGPILSRRGISAKRILIFEFGTWNLGLWTLDFGLWTLDFGLRTLDFGLRTLDFGLWTLDFGLWTLDFENDVKFGTLNTEIGTINTEIGTKNGR
jgi:hypothetical protein